MRRTLHNLLLSGYLLGPWAVACAQPARYWVSQPAHTHQGPTSDAAVVFIEERTLIWMNAVMLRSRVVGHEEAGCLHIAKHVGAAFFVDSLMPPRGDVVLTPKSATFKCPHDSAPIHWHDVIDSQSCNLSDLDLSSENGPFPFNAMMCGVGIDSVVAYTVKPAPAVAGRK